MNFIILADKYQKGMKSKGAVGLIKVNRRYTLFENQYDVIKSSFKKSKIIYVYGFDSKKINHFFDSQKYKDVIRIYNDKYEDLNYAYSLALASEYMNKDFFILFGDAILKKEIFSDFMPNNGSQIFINKKEKAKLGCVIDSNNIVQNISFDLENYITDMYYIHNTDNDVIRSLVNERKYNNCFVFEIINKMIDAGTVFKTIQKNQKNICGKISQKFRVEL